MAGAPPPEEDNGRHEPRFRAAASGDARVYQAGRDQHIAERDVHLHYADGVREARRALPGADAGVCPYPGLPAFEPDQSSWFFGRDQLTAHLVDHLDTRLREGGALAVVGTSGAGKSSLLRAGLLPALARGALPGSAHWPCVVLTPTADPLGTLTARLGEALALRVPGAHSPAGWAAAVRGALRQGGPGHRLVLVVDQLEELFTACESEPDRHAFLDLLSTLALPDPRGGTTAVLVVLGLRADFYGTCARYPHLRAALSRGQILVGPLSEPELRQVILFPARTVGLDVEPGLVDLLLRDLGVTTAHTADEPYEAGRLPLLAHALRGTWQQRHGHTLTVDGYRATGGIHQAVAATAEHLHTALDPAAQSAARTLFLHLVRLGDGVQDTRRRLPSDRLGTLGDDPAATARAVEAFADGRLLTRRQDGVEITHEALLRAWPRLRRWIDADRAGQLQHQQLEEAATDWARSGHDTGLLYRGDRLAASRAWADGPHAAGLSTTAAAFLAMSARHRQRALRIRRALVAVLTSLTLLASTAAVVAFQQRSTARTQRDAANFGQVTAQADRLRTTQSPLAARLDVVAHRMRPADAATRLDLVADGNNPLAGRLTGHDGPVRALAYAPGGGLLASGGGDGTVRLWDVSSRGLPTPRGEPLEVPGPMVMSLSVAADAPLLASGDNSGAVQVWNVADPDRPQPLGEPLRGQKGGHVMSVALSPDGRTLAVAGADPTVSLWRVSRTGAPRPLAELPVLEYARMVYDVAFSPDGTTLVSTAVDSTLWRWDMTDPARPRALGKPYTGSGSLFSVAFSPDGDTLAGGAPDGTVVLLDLSDPARPKARGRPLTGHVGGIAEVLFSPDGSTLVSCAEDRTVRRWRVTDPDSPQPLGEPLTGHTATVDAVAFSPDGRTLVSGGEDRAILLWSFPVTVVDDVSGAYSLAFARRGSTLFAATGDLSLDAWRLTDPSHPRPLMATRDDRARTGGDIALSADGRTLAADTPDLSVRLWNVADPAHVTPLGRPLDTPDEIGDLEFSPDGRILAGYDDTGAVRLWDVRDPRRATLLGRPLADQSFLSGALAFSPDSRTLAVSAAPNGINLWDVSSPARPRLLGRPLTGHTGKVLALAFTPDGRTLVSGASDGTARLWDTTRRTAPTPRGKPLTGHSGATASLAVSHDGQLLATGGNDATVRLWDITDPDHPISADRTLTGHTEGVRALVFSADDRTLAGAAAGPLEKSVRLWHLDPTENARRVCALTPGALTADDRRRHLPGLRFAQPCR
ncbi:nSTAND1 domain-containing NTPase [Streptomyces adonidis]|uniref:nSTAND1 domain-containing NTPase n=1 Tax=Streptomyces adonidis TaxID=3231367 RepID=UPI0034DB23FC